MTRRAAGLVAAAGLLALGAAFLSAFAAAFPPGIEAALASDLVLRELLAALVLFTAVLVPALLVDDAGRSPECHAGLFCLIVATPAVVALAAAGGIPPGDLLPAAALLVCCDLLASSWMRADPGGRHSPWIAPLVVALVAALPVVAWAAADLGGMESADSWGLISPLLAVRVAFPSDHSGWGRAAPCILTLVTLSVVLRVVPIVAGGKRPQEETA